MTQVQLCAMLVQHASTVTHTTVNASVSMLGGKFQSSVANSLLSILFNHLLDCVEVQIPDQGLAVVRGNVDLRKDSVPCAKGYLQLQLYHCGQ